MIDSERQRSFMTRYLVGEVSAEERTEYEERYLNDEGVFQELVTLENEMIDRYILGDLSPSDRKRFEHSFLSHPGRRETVEIARSLLSHSAFAEGITSQGPADAKDAQLLPGSRAPAWAMQIAVAVAFVTMTVGVLALFISNRGLGSEVKKLRSEQTLIARENDALRSEVEKLKADAQQSSSTNQQLAQLGRDRNTVVFTLADEATRGADGLRELVIPASASAVSLRLIMPRDVHSRYGLSVQTAEGNLVWRGNNMQPWKIGSDQQEIVVTLPSSLFHQGDYVIRVSAGKEDVVNNVAGFTFRAVKR